MYTCVACAPLPVCMCTRSGFVMTVDRLAGALEDAVTYNSYECTPRSAAFIALAVSDMESAAAGRMQAETKTSMATRVAA